MVEVIWIYSPTISIDNIVMFQMGSSLHWGKIGTSLHDKQRLQMHIIFQRTYILVNKFNIYLGNNSKAVLFSTSVI